MAKKKPTTETPRRGRPKSPTGPPVSVTTTVPPAIRDALDEARAPRRWSRSELVEFILEEWLKSNGFLTRP